MELLGVDVSIWLNVVLAVVIALRQLSDQRFRLEFTKLKGDLEDRRADAEREAETLKIIPTLVSLFDAQQKAFEAINHQGGEILRVLKDSPTRHDTTLQSVLAAAQKADETRAEIISNQEAMQSQTSAVIDKLNTMLPMLGRIETNLAKLESISAQVSDYHTPNTLRFQFTRVATMVSDTARKIDDVLKAIEETKEGAPPKPKTGEVKAAEDSAEPRPEEPPAAEEKPEGAEKEQGE